MKRYLAMLLVVALAIGATACAGGKSGGAGTTPEATVETFLEALKAQDLDAMLACCFIEDSCDEFDYQAYIVRQGFMNSTSQEAPAQYPLYRETMAAERRGFMANRIRMLASSLMMQTGDAGAWEAYVEDYGSKTQIILPREEEEREEIAAAFVKAVDPDGLRDLKVTQVQRFQPENEEQKASFETWAKMWGRKQAAEVHVTMELGEAQFQKGFTLVEVEGRWQIAMMWGRLLGNDSSMGAATRIN